MNIWSKWECWFTGTRSYLLMAGSWLRWLNNPWILYTWLQIYWWQEKLVSFRRAEVVSSDTFRCFHRGDGKGAPVISTCTSSSSSDSISHRPIQHESNVSGFTLHFLLITMFIGWTFQHPLEGEVGLITYTTYWRKYSSFPSVYSSLAFIGPSYLSVTQACRQSQQWGAPLGAADTSPPQA